MDFVGYGTANDFAGTGPTATHHRNTTSAQRTISPFTNTGNNATDFTAGRTHAQGATGHRDPALDCAVTPNDPACQPGPKTIQDIQGSGFLSPERGNVVERVAGHRHGGPVAGQQPRLLDPAAQPRRHPSRGLVRDLRLHQHASRRRG